MNKLAEMEAMAHTNPGNLANVLTLASAYMQMQNTARAVELFDVALKNPAISSGDVAQIIQIYNQLGNMPKLEAALQRQAELQPNVPETRFDLARLEATLGQTEAALKDLQVSLAQSQARLKADPTAKDLLAEARKDPNLNSLRSLPAFQKLVPAQ
jgi:thioredoxin-like negative regulator of GroEL